MKIYLATWLLEKSQGIALSRVRAQKRLLSYYHTLEKKDEFVKYIKSGK